MPENPIVILTRETHDNRTLADRLTSGNIDTVDYPCIRITPVPFRKGDSIDGLPLDAFRLLIFTSKRGVTGMKEVHTQLKESGQLLAVVGGVTAAAVEEHIGRVPDIIADPPTGKSLADTLIRLPVLTRVTRLLHIRGNKTTGDIREMFTTRGFHLSERIVYRNVIRQSGPLDLPENRCGIVVFASPSAVEGFTRSNSGLIRTGRLRYLAIGPVTAGCLREKRMGPVSVAGKPDLQSVFDVIKNIVGG